VFAALWLAGTVSLELLGWPIGWALVTPAGALLFLAGCGLTWRMNWLLRQMLFHGREAQNNVEAAVPMLSGMATRLWPYRKDRAHG
jgi:hypothetical protein